MNSGGRGFDGKDHDAEIALLLPRLVDLLDRTQDRRFLSGVELALLALADEWVDRHSTKEDGS